MNIKTIIVDLDRTLLRTDKTLSSYTVEVLRECRKNGIRIMVAADYMVQSNDDEDVARFVEQIMLKKL